MFLSEDDLNLIFNKYKKNGAFNYLAFCHDVDPGMGWLWSVGPIKLKVSFAKEPYKRDDILGKRAL